MEIREGTSADIPEIIALLKLSLGEGLMPKSEQYWRWKHVENPFGPSPVLLCWEGNTLVGVRAFMQWQWYWQGRLYRAVRAVDTATHPAYQGKGIFKKLTLGLVKECLQNGNDFVFNTPNNQSKPGYLKMGWIEAGRLPIRASLNNPLGILKNLVSKSNGQCVEDNAISYYLSSERLQQLSEVYPQPANKMVTNISLKYLQWRYIDVPVARYIAICDEKQNESPGLIIARMKQTPFGRELRITDVFLKDRRDHLIQRLKECRRMLRIDYCTLSGTASAHDLLLGKRSINFAVGPVVTVRSLGLQNIDILKQFNNWSPSLGDLELF